MAEESASKIKVKKPPIKAKTFTFTLSLPAMISAVGSGILALSFFFVMGILIGRGYRPESDVPRLGELMPTKEHGQLTEEPAKPEILKAEELGYPDRLKAQPDRAAPAAPAPKPAPKPEPKPAPKPAPAAEANAAEKPAAFQPEAAKPGEPVFDYVYQVASFRKAEMADALSARLVGAGLRTGIASGDVGGSTWYRVQVLHHGTPASTGPMKDVLARFGISKPLLKKKTPAQ
ncbi:SPOR domain-containing protein [Pseudodesulfovibrio sp.]|uniref:SPOR domain-containing protein n=1 Tax=Pseudodesulfovibrio sp. TaxID=2035812 RepID=UPI002619FBE7|nr:SPOR domain-containing protein [Pseudodesulfovibrio sp.]MDD3311038.1 SPOR domain-containing protein [Pseudodesulfovibrio sp.]